MEDEFHRLDGLLSRFRPESELCELNERGSMVVGEDLLRVTEIALEARERTDGRVDPTVHDALLAAGYDRTFSEIPPDAAGEPVQTLVRCGGRVTVDRRLSIIELEPGTRLDFGGIAKGDAVDRACRILAAAGRASSAPAATSRSTASRRRASGRWTSRPPRDDSPEADDGAVATSGRDLRRWRRGGRELHHLIDPTTGLPAETGLLRVTAVAGSAVEAEIMAKALFLAGEEKAVSEAEELGVPRLLVTEDGRTVWAGGLTPP